MTSVVSKTAIYTATCEPIIEQEVQAYLDQLDGKFALLVDCFGHQPKITKYFIDFKRDGGAYFGAGRIEMSDNIQNLKQSPPDCFDGALVFETIHGFLEPLRHPPFGISRARIGENRIGESFSTIIEIEFLKRVGGNRFADRYKRGRGMGRYHYPLLNALVQIYDRHGIHIFQNLFRWVEAQGEANNLVFDVKVYGREETHPYSVLYMERLAEVFRNAAAIDERELFLEYAALR